MDEPRTHRTCPVWLGYFLLNPFRKFAHSPARLVGGRVREGMTTLDAGCAMGFFSLPLARMAGASGRVICVDFQEGMLAVLKRRAAKAGLADRIIPRRCTEQSLEISDFEGKVDVAVAFAVVHEVGDKARFLREIATTLKPGGLLFLSEPRGHVKSREFERALEMALACGLTVQERPWIWATRSAWLVRSGPVQVQSPPGGIG